MGIGDRSITGRVEGGIDLCLFVNQSHFNNPIMPAAPFNTRTLRRATATKSKQSKSKQGIIDLDDDDPLFLLNLPEDILVAIAEYVVGATIDGV